MNNNKIKLLGSISLIFAGLSILLSLFQPINLAVFSTVNSAAPSKALWMTITNSGDVIFVGCLLLIALHKHRGLLTYAVLCGITIHYIVKFAKNTFGVLRPEYAGLDHLVRLGPKLSLDNYAMPSGHTASAFMAIVFIAFAHKLNGWKWWMLFVYAALVACSRVAVGAHWPADVCAGAAVGLVMGWIFTELASRNDWALKHKAIQYISLLLYLPFIVLAITHIRSIHGITSLINQGPIVFIGVLALMIWIQSFMALIRKSPL